jgi:putative transposase
LNNLVEQEYRFIKKITKPMMGFNALYSAKVTIAGIETSHMIRKEQLSEENIPA